MADYFDSAQTQADASKAALLAAITQYGSQAHQALQAGQDQLAAARQAAIGQQLGTGQQMAAPAALQNELSARVGAPYDQRIASLGTEAASRQAGFDNQAAGANTYMTEANAALPAIRGQLAQKVATLQAQAQAQLEKGRQDQAMQALTFQQGQALKNIELQIAQANLAKAQQSGSAKAASPSSIISQGFGSNENFVNQLDGPVNADVGQAAALGMLNGYGGTTGNADVGSMAARDAADAYGAAIGLPSGYAGTLFGNQQTKDAAAAARDEAAAARQSAAAAKNAPNPDLGPGAPTPAEVNAVKTTRAYKDALDAAKAARDQGWNADQLDQAMQQGMQKTYGHDFPRTRDIVRRMYASGQL